VSGGGRIGVATLVTVVDALQAAGDAGLSWGDVSERVPGIWRDKGAGWLTRKLRDKDYLVQVEDYRLYLLPDVDCRKGACMRHDELGIVIVEYEREGFDLVRVRPIGGEDSHKVHRNTLKGK